MKTLDRSRPKYLVVVRINGTDRIEERYHYEDAARVACNEWRRAGEVSYVAILVNGKLAPLA